jgi:hypothetical protein
MQSSIRFSAPAALLVVLASALIAAAQPSATAPTQPIATAPNLLPGAHLKVAMELVQSVSPEHTSYRHTDCTVEWRGDTGAASSICHTDCSGLVTAVLKRTYSLTDDNFRQWLHARRPVARHYYAAIEKKEGFLPVATVPEARPGDLLAVKYEQAKKGDNTGHVMIVATAPRERTATEPIVSGTRQWEVKVVDQSSSYHGHADTRYTEGKKKHGGVGAGVMRIYSDADGNVVGYTWSTSRKSKFETPTNRPLLIGRIDPEFIQSLKAAGP